MAEQEARMGDALRAAAGRLAGEVQRRPYTAAAIASGAAAATAGAFIGARALARRNGATDGHPVNQVLQNAITACEAAAAPCAEINPRGDAGLDGS
jgi:hypothetical protein